MNGKAIGVFDSGVGGLTVLRALWRRLPAESTVYLGDTARVPYGSRSPDVVIRYSLANARFLMGHDVKLLVVACNTASAVALGALSQALDIPVLGVIDPGARAAVAASRAQRIGVLGTRGTIASGAYQRALRRLCPSAEVRAVACPLFVPLAEEGWIEGEPALGVARRYLGDLEAFGPDALVLGCTHYPLLRGVIGEVVGPRVALVDSAEATARAAADLLADRGLEAQGDRPPAHLCFVTDLPGRFAEVGARFLEQPVLRVEQVELPEWP